ncbi:hypothetical protein CAOG_009928 [Capsaspora owczarzaki ATCC 30864]|uniref:SAP domain-containing protein n=1 Tax=Capsaspora owczarzaki (strain ATCC 30864) TaxID=595528 RepID=A0A0D2VVG7_CAPO3|nr:hypothetical protein CAOG_009928 [Capsaspora owczarzaki ATCC 30864]
MSTAAAPKTEKQWLSLSAEQLRKELTKRGLASDGFKKVMAARLVAHDAGLHPPPQQHQQQQNPNSSSSAGPPPAPLALPAAPAAASANTGNNSVASTSSSNSDPSSSAAGLTDDAPPPPAEGTTFIFSSDEVKNFTIPDEINRLLRVHGNSVELLDRKISSNIFEDLLASGRAPEPRYLSGVGGVGKSSILLMMVVLAMRHNRAFFERFAAAPAPAPAPALAPGSFDGAIFLIYLPKTGAFCHETSEVAASQLIGDLRIANRRLLRSGLLDEPAFELLKDAFVHRKTSSGHFESALNQWGRINAALVGLESQSHRFRTLVLIDQWNSIIHAKALPVGDEDQLKADHPAQAFYRLSTRFGFSLFVAAVSSSPRMDSSNALSGSQCGGAEQPIEFLTDEEAETLRAIWYYRSPPFRITAASMKRLHLKFGGVARILQYYATSQSHKNPEAEFRRLCEQYYDHRLDRLIERLRPTTEFTSLVCDLATIVARTSIPERTPEVWLQTGLVKQDPTDQSQLVPVSDLVRAAAVRRFNAERANLMRIVFDNPATTWSALEIFVLSCLQYASQTLKGTDLSDESVLELTTTVDNVHVLDRSITNLGAKNYLAAFNGDQPFPVGTLLIPGWPNHPVADAVLLTRQNDDSNVLIFFQISKSSYADHQTKVPNLVSNKIGNASVLAVYRELFGLPNNVDYNPPSIAQGKLDGTLVKYVYATLDESTAEPDHDVFLMREAHVRELDSEAWAAMAGVEP